MDSYKSTPNREEYFYQLINKAESHIYNKAWLEIDKANLDKEDILAITYDPNVALQKRVEELEAVGMELIHAMNQKQFFLDGYSKGSASIAEASGAMADEHAAYSKLFDTIKNKKS